MPLCCCKVTITIGLTKVTMCQGVDSCGDKVCSNLFVSTSLFLLTIGNYLLLVFVWCK